MKTPEVATVILEGITPAFVAHNFKLNRKKREFKRGNKNITQLVDFYFNKTYDGLSIEPEIRIKVKPIEDIYRSVTTTENRPYKTLVSVRATTP